MTVVVSPVVLVPSDPVYPVSPPSTSYPSPPVPVTVTVDDVPGRPQLAVRGLHPGADDQGLGGDGERPAYILVTVACNRDLTPRTMQQLSESW